MVEKVLIEYETAQEQIIITHYIIYSLFTYNIHYTVLYTYNIQFAPFTNIILTRNVKKLATGIKCKWPVWPHRPHRPHNSFSSIKFPCVNAVHKYLLGFNVVHVHVYLQCFNMEHTYNSNVWFHKGIIELCQHNTNTHVNY